MPFGLSPTQERVFALLMSESIVSRRLLKDTALNGCSDVNVNVQIHKMRKKLKSFGVEIVNSRGQGYRLTLETKTRVRAMMEAEAS